MDCIIIKTGYSVLYETDETAGTKVAYHGEGNRHLLKIVGKRIQGIPNLRKYELRADGTVVKSYSEFDGNLPADVRAPRKLSKLSLETALLKRGLLGKWDTFLDGTFIPGTEYALRRFYDQANDLSESHPMCDSFKVAAKTALGVDDTEFDAILDESVWAD